MTRTVLEVRNLQVTYRTKGRVIHAVQDASVAVGEGEAVGIAGESGSGKSTLARAVMGLLPSGVAQVAAGEILVQGRNVTHLTPTQWESVRGHPLAMVFQDPLSFLNPVLRVGRQIGESVRRHDPDADPAARCLELIELVRLQPNVLRRYPHELSGGMRQRVMLAIALGCRPRLLIADEPTTALDVTTQAEILELLRDLRARLRMSLLLISHDLGVLRWNCERTYIMYAGHTIESGATAAVLRRPSHPYTRGLIEASRLRRGADGTFATIGGDVPSLDRVFDLCPFLSRCQVSREVCRSTMPPVLGRTLSGQGARCWLIEPGCRREDAARADA